MTLGRALQACTCVYEVKVEAKLFGVSAAVEQLIERRMVHLAPHTTIPLITLTFAPLCPD